jgi:hypothetical protein
MDNLEYTIHNKYKTITHRMLCLTLYALAVSGLLIYAFILLEQTAQSAIISNRNVFYYYLAIQITFYVMYVIINLCIFVCSYAMPKELSNKIVIVQLFNNNNILFSCSIIAKVAYFTAVIILLAKDGSLQLTNYFKIIILETILFIIMVYILFNVNERIKAFLLISSSYKGESNC